MPDHEQVRKGSNSIGLAAILDLAQEPGLLKAELTPWPPADFVYITRNGCSTLARQWFLPSG
jgi:hypothetical protein